jgi:hypothetical protein
MFSQNTSSRISDSTWLLSATGHANIDYNVHLVLGVNAMINIFGDLDQFVEKTLSIYTKTNVLANFLNKLTSRCISRKKTPTSSSSFSSKETPTSLESLGENIYKITTLIKLRLVLNSVLLFLFGCIFLYTFCSF